MEAERAVRGRRDGDPAGAARKARELDLVEGEVPRRLRAEREKRGMSVRELARRLDLTPSAISQIETGRARPSVSTLYSIVTELGLSLDGLFNQGATQPPPTAAPQASSVSVPAAAGADLVQRAGSRRTIELDGGVQWERLTVSPDPDVDFLFVNYPVGSATSAGGVLMRHAGREYGVVLSGRLEVTVAFEAFVLEPGDSISFASTTPHRLANVGDEPATGIWVVIGRRGSDARADALADEPVR